jgi:choline dehydrogenase-like flavoprotein
VLVQRKYSLPEDIVTEERLPRTVFLFHPNRLSARRRLLALEAAGAGAHERVREARATFRASGWSSRTIRAAAAGISALPTLGRLAGSKASLRVRRRFVRSRMDEPDGFSVHVMAEQVPNPHSRVRLTGDHDRFGLPVAALDWRLTAQDLKAAARTQSLLASHLAATARVHSFLDGRQPPPGLAGGAHHMGTTRMHDVVRRGVVDRDCRLHGVPNVYVAGSSVFPTVGYANPTLTALALALRLGDHLRDRR